MKSYQWSSFATALACILAAQSAHAQTEDAKCRSPNPADWPAPPRPYFLLAVDTSGSMAWGMAQNSCGYPANRSGGARCAVYNTVRAFSGLVNFGLMAFPRTPIRTTGTPPATLTANGVQYLNGDTPGCNIGSLYNDYFATSPSFWSTCDGCGLVVADSSSSAGSRGGNLLVPLQSDTPTSTSNVSEILSWVDNQVSDCKELWAEGGTPLNGMLRDVHRYLSNRWSRPVPQNRSCTNSDQCYQGLRCVSGNCEDVWPYCDATHACPTGTTCNAGSCEFPTPLTGTERACRSVNVVLVTDGEESCNPQGGSSNQYCRETSAANAADAAADLYTGFTIGGVTWHVKTHVIALGTAPGTNEIAVQGQTNRAYIANNEAELSAALANIVAGAIPPEVCDNQDNNCNGCTDEGSRPYCNRGRQATAAPTQAGQCCQWTTSGQRQSCVASYQASITSGKPQGDLWLLPCWDPSSTPGGLTSEQAWLCVDPGEICDEKDNNCDVSPILTTNPAPDNLVDEGFRKCVQDSSGTLKCPGTETCDGIDNDCDGVRDNTSGGCPNPCVPGPEICDGRDNDCDTAIDEGLDIPCGLLGSSVARCQGTRSCVNGQYTECSWTTNQETCNGEDDDCDGLVDDGVAPTPCVPAGLTGLVFYDEAHPLSRCRMGEQPCGSDQCFGGVGPLPGGEVCNGYDDDCDGVVDECPQAEVEIGGVSYCTVMGEGNECGSAVGTCQKGRTICQTGGFLDCSGGVGPQPELCDGIDSDCDGIPDERETLVDAPAEPGCWNKARTDLDCDPLAANCAQGALAWCAPQGATCHGLGTLTSPCSAGTLACVGGTWVCDGGRFPGAEKCDGADNDCDGIADDNLGPPEVGGPCFEAKGECKAGTTYCDLGRIACSGQGPTAEICDGKDNDCDGTIDNGLGLGDTCSVAVDATQYPGIRALGLCRPGRSECDPAGSGAYLCHGGVGPTPELCDGLDNDCDGQVDETGPAPDGIDGTVDASNQRVGDPCGASEGLCEPGHLACVQGKITCTGGLGAQVETCDCADNNCNGLIDDPDDPQLCSRGKTCVRTAEFCVCAVVCGDGEFACPTGTNCMNVTKSGSQVTGGFCIPANPCGTCETKTIAQAGAQAGVFECGPAGTLSQGKPVPVCVCKGQAGCHSPCYNVACAEGQSCVPSGQWAGQCQPANDCRFFGCDQGRVCKEGSCVADPCSPNPCPSGQVCKPNATFTEHRCVGSCAEVTCGAGQLCAEGACVDSGCASGCPTDQYCQAVAGGGFSCGPNKCLLADGGTACATGIYCSPVTGQCGNDPCTGVVCPTGQICREGECYTALVTTDGGVGGAGGAATATGGGTPITNGGEGATGATTGATSTGNVPYREPSAWGLATGGGGCACNVTGQSQWPKPAVLSLLGLLIALGGSRRRRRPTRPGSAAAKGGAQ